MNMCSKCSKIAGWLVLVVGAVYLLADLGVWSLGGVSVWSVLLVLAGLCMICSGGCADCQKMCKK